MFHNMMLIGAALLATGGVLLLWRKGSWPGVWPVEGEPIMLGALGVLIYLGYAVAASFAAKQIQGNLALLHLAIGAIRLFCAGIFFFIVKTMVHDLDPMHKWRPTTLEPVLICLGAYLLILPLMFMVQPNADQQAIQDLVALDGFLPKAFMFFGLVIAAPLFEELLFRGFFQGAMRRAFPTQIAIPVVAVFFTLAHESAVYIPVLCLGLLLGVVYEKTRGFWAPWMIHTLHNLITYIFIVSGGVDA